MYTKEELEKLPIPELMEIASELGIKVSQNDELESVVYAILDKAAENSAAGVSTPKRKRTRIAAKDNSKVYAVNGSDCEAYDKEATKVEKKKKKPSLEALIAEQAAAEKAERKSRQPKPMSTPKRLLPRSAAARRRMSKRLLPQKPPSPKRKPRRRPPRSLRAICLPKPNLSQKLPISFPRLQQKAMTKDSRPRC